MLDFHSADDLGSHRAAGARRQGISPHYKISPMPHLPLCRPVYAAKSTNPNLPELVERCSGLRASRSSEWIGVAAMPLSL